MSRVDIQTLEEKFMFGSPPLLNGFSCRLEDTYTPYFESCSKENCDSTLCDMNSFNNYKSHNGKQARSTQLLGAFNQLSLNAGNVENGMKILEKAGIKLHSNEPVFKKRKDLRTLQNNLSKERYREVVMKFGDGGEDGGKEILASVHTTMKKNKLLHMSCLFCEGQSQVYENFPVVDGTLFVSPLRLSRDCAVFYENNAANESPRYMSYICVKCQEGQSKTLKCADCAKPWNGSFFQVGTLYSYNILSAIPCCQTQFSCKKCHKETLSANDTSSLFFSHFSKKTMCPHCNTEDFHFVKPLSSFAITHENN